MSAYMQTGDNPVTKHTIVRWSFRVMGPSNQAASRRLYEAAYIENNDNIFHEDPNVKAVITTEDAEDNLPISLNDADSDDEDDAMQHQNIVPRYGNDVGLDNDPVENESERRIIQHVPKTMAPHELALDHFVVEKILNHKGTAARPGSMELYVKWLGYEDKDNSWIKWKDN